MADLRRGVGKQVGEKGCYAETRDREQETRFSCGEMGHYARGVSEEAGSYTGAAESPASGKRVGVPLSGGNGTERKTIRKMIGLMGSP